MLWIEAILMLVGGFICAAVMCAAAAFAIYKLLGDDNDKANW
jgi:hypothetical protein